MMAALMSIMYYHPITAIPLSRFLLFEISFVVVGIGLLPLGNHQRKKSKMHWAEMQNIRNLIKNEFAIRDAKLGIKSE